MVAFRNFANPPKNVYKSVYWISWSHWNFKYSGYMRQRALMYTLRWFEPYAEQELSCGSHHGDQLGRLISVHTEELCALRGHRNCRQHLPSTARWMYDSNVMSRQQRLHRAGRMWQTIIQVNGGSKNYTLRRIHSDEKTCNLTACGTWAWFIPRHCAAFRSGRVAVP